MSPVFIDTSYYVALLNPKDRFHEKAVRLGAAIKQRTIVTEFVLLEFGNASCHVNGRGAFVQLLERVRRDPKVILVPASAELFAAGCELYASRPDKEWSLTDCTSFVVMREYAATDALTTDHHFEQAGFNVLLK